MHACEARCGLRRSTKQSALSLCGLSGFQNSMHLDLGRNKGPFHELFKVYPSISIPPDCAFSSQCHRLCIWSPIFQPMFSKYNDTGQFSVLVHSTIQWYSVSLPCNDSHSIPPLILVTITLSTGGLPVQLLCDAMRRESFQLLVPATMRRQLAGLSCYTRLVQAPQSISTVTQPRGGSDVGWNSVQDVAIGSKSFEVQLALSLLWNP